MILMLLSVSCKIYAMSLYCTYSSFYVYYTCDATIITGENDEILTELYGLHRNGNSDNNVNRLWLMGQNLKFFPKNVENFFPNLKIIDLSLNSITSLTNSDLKPHQHLRRLILERNQITVLERNLFDGMSLKYINLDYNNIEHADNDIQLPMHSHLSFQNNTCIDKIASTPMQIINFIFLLRDQCPPTTFIRASLGTPDNKTESTTLVRNESFSINDNVIDDLKNKNLYLKRIVGFLEKRLSTLEARLESEKNPIRTRE